MIRLRAPRPLALQIWLVTAAAVLAASVAIVVIAAVAFHPSRRGGPFAAEARYVTLQLEARLTAGGEAALARELALVSDTLRVGAAAYRWDGTLVAATREPAPPPLDADEARRLAVAREIERQGGCTRERCQMAFALGGGAAAPAAYAVLDREWHRPPGEAAGPWLPIALVLLGLGVAALVLGGSIARPLQRLAATARALGDGDLDARTGIVRRDELGEMARAFDDMAARIGGLLRAQTELLANVAHELRSPLARIRVALDLAEDGEAGVARESLAEIAEDLSELEGLVDDILASARMDLARSTASRGAPPLRRVRLDLGALARGSAERLQHRHPDRRVELQLAADLPEVEGDTVLLRRLLDNLLDNARKYAPADRTITVRAERAEGGVRVQVIDQGEGLAPEDLARLFTPFFRADRSRTRATGGVGLGLSLSRSIAEAHGGSLSAASVLGAGTTLTLALPAAPPVELPAAPVTSAGSPPAPGRGA